MLRVVALAAMGDRAKVEFTWDVATKSGWMNLLAPLRKRAFAWNHNYVMNEGEKALARYLQGPAKPS
jgi:hypothetical protein